MAKNERIYSSLANSHYAEEYLELFQTSKMEHVAKKVKGLSLASQNALRCLNGSEYSIELRTKINLP